MATTFGASAPLWITYSARVESGSVTRAEELEIYLELHKLVEKHYASGESRKTELELQESKNEMELLKSYDDLYAALRETQGRDQRKQWEVVGGIVKQIIAERGDLAQSRSAINRPVVEEAIAVYEISGGTDHIGAWRKFFGSLTDKNVPLSARVKDQQMPAMMRKLIRHIGGVEWDPNNPENGGITFTGAGWGDPEATSADRRNMIRLGIIASQAERTYDAADKYLFDMEAQVGNAIKGPDADLPKELEDLRAIVYDPQRGLSQVESADEIAGAEARQAARLKADEVFQRQVDDLNMMRKRLFPGETEDLRVKAFSNPAFLQWAEEHGYRNVGRVVDGEYIQGRDDYFVLASAYYESRRRVSRAGRPKYAIGTPRTTGNLVKVTYYADPEETERLRNRDGNFYQKIQADGTATYIDEGEYRDALKPKLYALEIGKGRVLRDERGRLWAMESLEDGSFEVRSVELSAKMQDRIREYPAEMWQTLVIKDAGGSVARFASADDVSDDLVISSDVELSETRGARNDILDGYREVATLGPGSMITVAGAQMPLHINYPGMMPVRVRSGIVFIPKESIVENGLVVLETQEDAGLRDWMYSIVDARFADRAEALAARLPEEGPRIDPSPEVKLTGAKKLTGVIPTGLEESRLKERARPERKLGDTRLPFEPPDDLEWRKIREDLNKVENVLTPLLAQESQLADEGKDTSAYEEAIDSVRAKQRSLLLDLEALSPTPELEAVPEVVREEDIGLRRAPTSPYQYQQGDLRPGGYPESFVPELRPQLHDEGEAVEAVTPPEEAPGPSVGEATTVPAEEPVQESAALQGRVRGFLTDPQSPTRLGSVQMVGSEWYRERYPREAGGRPVYSVDELEKINRSYLDKIEMARKQAEEAGEAFDASKVKLTKPEIDQLQADWGEVTEERDPLVAYGVPGLTEPEPEPEAEETVTDAEAETKETEETGIFSRAQKRRKSKKSAKAEKAEEKKAEEEEAKAEKAEAEKQEKAG